MTEERDDTAPAPGAFDRAWVPPDPPPPHPPPPSWSGTAEPPPPPPPAALTAYAEPTPPRRHPVRRAATVVAALAVLVTSTVVVAQLGDDDGATSPEAAVEHLFSALEHEDAIGVLESLPPSERDVVGEPLRGLVGELQRLDVLADFDLHDVPGIDIEVDDLELDATELGEGVTAVRITGGTISGAAVPAELPIGDLIEDMAGEDLDLPDEEERDTADLADADLELIAIEEGGRWHVSLFYTIAEAARGDAPVPDFGNGIVPVGADTPEGAVRALVDAAADLDAEAVIAMLPPDEMRVLYDYGPLFVDDADEAAEEIRDEGFVMTVDRLDLHAEGDGSERTVVLDGMDVSAESQDMAMRATFDGECTTLEGTGLGWSSIDGADERFVAVGEAIDGGPSDEYDEPEEFEEFDYDDYDDEDDEDDQDEPEVVQLCADGTMTVDGEEMDLGPLEGSGLVGLGQASPQLTVVEVDGRWYVSPMRSLLDPMLGWLEGVERSDLEGFVEDMESWMSEPAMEFEEVGEAIEGSGYDDDLTTEDEAAADRCWTLVELDPSASLTPGDRQQFLMNKAVQDCLDEAGLGGMGPAMEQCWDAYAALPASADEGAWAAADAEVSACLDAEHGPELTDGPRVVGTMVVVPEEDGAIGFDPVTGAERWRMRECPGSWPGWATPTAGNATEIEVLECDGELVAIEAATGTVRWRRPDDLGRDRTRVGPTALVTQNDDAVQVTDLRTGAELWSSTELGEANVAVTTTTVFVSNNEGVGGFELTTGARRWWQPLPASGLGADDRWVVLRSNDWVVAFADAAGTLLAASETDPDGLAWSDVVALTDVGAVLQSTEPGRQLSAYAPDGTRLWTRRAAPESTSQVNGDGAHVVVVEDCTVVVLDALTGAELPVFDEDRKATLTCMPVDVEAGVVYAVGWDADGRLGLVVQPVP